MIIIIVNGIVYFLEVPKVDAIGGNNLDERLDSKIKASVKDYLAMSDKNHSSPTSETIIAICERLDKLESQLLGESNSNQTTAIDNLANLEQKVEGLTARMTQLAEAIIKIQDYLNNQQKRGQKSYYNNSSFKAHTRLLQPLTEEGKAQETWCK